MLLAPWNSSSILEQNSCAKDLPFYIFVSTHDKTRASRIQLQKLDMPYLLHWKPNPKAHEALMPSELLILLLNICLLPSMQTVSNGGYPEGTRDCWQCSLQPLFTVKESVTSSSNTKQLWMMPFQTDSFNHLPEWNVCSFSQKSSSSSPTQPPLLLFPSFFPDEFTSAKMAVSVPPPPKKKEKKKEFGLTYQKTFPHNVFRFTKLSVWARTKVIRALHSILPSVRGATNPLFLTYIRTWLGVSSTVFWSDVCSISNTVRIHIYTFSRHKQDKAALVF